MTDDLYGISRCLVEFADGRQVQVVSSDTHEWVLHYAAKELEPDEWCDGVLEEIDAYVGTWQMVSPDSLNCLKDALQQHINTLEEEWLEKN